MSSSCPDLVPGIHMWTAPWLQGIAEIERLLAVICPACWCGHIGPLAQMGSADRDPNTSAAFKEALDAPGLIRSSDQPINHLVVLLQVPALPGPCRATPWPCVDRSHRGASWPRRYGQFCWPTPRRPVSWVCARTA